MSNADEAAFPVPHVAMPEGEHIHQGVPGLTKREYFAAMAMQGIIAGNQPVCFVADCEKKFAKAALMIADAILTALNASIAAEVWKHE